MLSVLQNLEEGLREGLEGPDASATVERETPIEATVELQSLEAERLESTPMRVEDLRGSPPHLREDTIMSKILHEVETRCGAAALNLMIFKGLPKSLAKVKLGGRFMPFAQDNK